ncbi:MAG: TCP-1/cpn60 chaperonin family protein [Poseidonia sp.]
MAGANDGSGRAPVAIVRPTTTVTSGLGVTQKLVTAAVAFGDLMRGTFGPQGLDKMLYKTNGETAVTNDGAKIVAELLVKHPAAKAFVQLAESQEQACGDGVTGCLIFASELMREAGRLLERGLHPLVVVNGFQLALEVTLSSLASLSEACNGREETLLGVARTAMNGTSADTGSDTLASMVVQALNLVRSTDGVDHEDVRMSKRTQGNIHDTRLVEGLLLDTALHLDRLPRQLSNGTVLVLTCPLDQEEAVRETEIEVEDAQQWLAFIEAKERLLKAKTEAVRSTGATAVFTAGTIEPSVFHDLTDAGCFVMGGLDRTIIDDLAKATGGSLCDHLDDAGEAVLGGFERLTVETSEDLDGRRERLCLRVGQTAGLVTLDVGGGDGAAVEEVIRGLYDALRSTSLAMATDRVVRGGGSTHMHASLAVKEAAEHQAGRERLAMEAFARALEAIPSTLAQNAGVERLDAMLALRAEHRAGKAQAGVDASGGVSTITSTWLPAETLHHALEAATETACGLLRVDQVISARGD